MKRYEKISGELKPEDVEECVQAAVASNRLEGLVATDEEIDMLRKYANGGINKDEYKAWALKHAGVAK